MSSKKQQLKRSDIMESHIVPGMYHFMKPDGLYSEDYYNKSRAAFYYIESRQCEIMVGPAPNVKK